MRALLLAASALALALPAPAQILRSKGDHKRHGITERVPAFSHPTLSEESRKQALESFNAVHPSGLGPARMGVASAGGGPPAGESTAGQMAPAFLAESKPQLGIDPQQLELVRESRGESGDRHALYRQVYKGLPVEFSRVKVHFEPSGKVSGLDSNFRPHLDLDVRPLIAASVAAYTVQQDLGAAPKSRPELLVMLDPHSGEPRLAWKMTASKDGLWRYYVDARSGEIILRYDDMRYACSTARATGRVKALIYAIDQEHGPPTTVPVPNEYIFLDPSPGVSTHTITRGSYSTSSGTYCFDNNASFNNGVGKIHAGLQGPYVRVANFRGTSAYYENNTCSSGTWTTVGLGTPVASAHPYANNTNEIMPVDVGSIVPPATAAVRPVFTNFNVGAVSGGAFGEASEITDDDQVTILDPIGYPVANFVGNRGTFDGPAVQGTKFGLRLKSNDSGTQYGFDMASARYITLGANANLNGVCGTLSPAINPCITEPCSFGVSASTNGSFHWTASSFNVLGMRAEAAAFVHLNQMADYFLFGANAKGPDSGSPRYIGLTPVAAMVLMGPNLLNAFYDPDFDGLYFGDVNTLAPQDTFTDDSTVVRHEYTHYVVQKIFNLQNFGEAGAISEGVADYFSLSSLDPGDGTGTSRITGVGQAVNQALGGSGPLRELDSVLHPPSYTFALGEPGETCSTPGCQLRTWAGEIHDDSVYISQALWDIRRQMISRINAADGAPSGYDRTDTVNGISCTDNLVFNALKFYPESFFEFREALKKAAGYGVATCASVAAGTIQADITTAFANHGIPVGNGDVYDTALRRNDGFETAVDISTLSPVSATIFPDADTDFFTFGAGPGDVQIRLLLPVDGEFYSGYLLSVFDRNHTLISEPVINYDGFNTNGGVCTSDDCTTTTPEIVAQFFNPTAQQLYVRVSGGPTDVGFSNSAVSNSTPYTLITQYQRPGAVNSGIVSATVDNDVISYEVSVTTWYALDSQAVRLSYLQLRDHAENLLPNTKACRTTNTSSDCNHAAVNPTSHLIQQGPVTEALGKISGQVRLQNGFNARFPALGTVYLEVFGYNVHGSTISLGLSQALNLATDRAEAKVWNNVFNPAAGQKTTFRYDVREAGRLTARLYTMNGTFVRTLFDGEVLPGKGSVDWHGQNFSGSTVASGIYLLHIQGPGIKKTQKIAVIK